MGLGQPQGSRTRINHLGEFPDAGQEGLDAPCLLSPWLGGGRAILSVLPSGQVLGEAQGLPDREQQRLGVGSGDTEDNGRKWEKWGPRGGQRVDEGAEGRLVDGGGFLSGGP